MIASQYVTFSISNGEDKVLLKRLNPLMIGLILLGTAITGAIAFYSISQFGQAKETPPSTQPRPTVRKITALGRLEPKTEVISLSAPLILDSDRVAQLLVQEGDRVQVGQVIAILDSRDRLNDAWQQAQKQVQVAQSRLAQVKAGAKTGEIGAQQATIGKLEAQWQGDKTTQQATLQRLEAQVEGEIGAQKAAIGKLEAEWKNAQAEHERYQQLYRQGAISESSYDSKGMTLETSRQQVNEAKVTLKRIERTGRQQINEARATLEQTEGTGRQEVNEARATLDKVAEVRPVDVQIAQAEVDSAIATAQKAETELKQAYIRSPINGQIIKIRTRPGEKINDDGIVDLAQTDQMEVVAEIYQTDIGKIREGHLATITGESFSGELRGTVRLIGLQVNQQNVFSNEPGENLDRKVIEVRISLRPEDSDRVASLTNSQVRVSLTDEKP